MDITRLDESPSPYVIVDGEEVDLDATDNDVLYPYKFIGAAGVISTGKMRDLGQVVTTLFADQEYFIPEGYHNGLGSVQAADLASQIPGSIVAANIVKDKTVWVNGEKITGTMTTNAKEITAIKARYGNPTIYVSIPTGAYQQTTHMVKVDSKTLSDAIKISAADIAYGQTVLGQSGTFSEDGNVTADQVKSGKVIYSKGKRIVGTMEVPTLW